MAQPDDGALAGTALSIARIPAGGHVVGGLIEQPGGQELFALKLDAGHCVVAAWRRPLTPPGAQISALLALPDGGLAVGGRTAGSGGSGDEEAWLARFRRDGEPLWSLVQGEFLYVSGLFDTPSREVVQALALLPDGRLAAAGRADVNGALYSNWLLLLQPDGHRPLRIDLPRDDPRIPGDFAAIAQAGDGRLALAGTLAAGDAKADAWVVVLAADGELLWDRRFRLPGAQAVAAALWLQDGLLLAGRQGMARRLDGWLLLVGADGKALSEAHLLHAAQESESLLGLSAAGSIPVAVGRTGRGAEGGGWLLRLDERAELAGALTLSHGSLAAVATLDSGGVLAAGREAEGGPPLLLLLPGPPSD